MVQNHSYWLCIFCQSQHNHKSSGPRGHTGMPLRIGEQTYCIVCSVAGSQEVTESISMNDMNDIYRLMLFLIVIYFLICFFFVVLVIVQNIAFILFLED